MTDSVNEQIKLLESQVDVLLRHCARLKEENRVLLESQASLSTERAALIEKNDMARARIEGMIGRLKALEQNA